MLTFIHTADIHFGMENYGRIDPQAGIHSRLLDFKHSLDTCIDYAIEHDVDLFIFSGDAYKTTNPSPTQQKLLLECFLRLVAHQIPVVIVIGNHDNPLSFGKAHALDIFNQMPTKGFHVIARPRALRIRTKSGPIQIVGIPWPTRNTISLRNAHILKSATEITEYISRAVATIIKKTAEQLDPTIPAILAGHLTVSSGVFSGSEKRAIYGTDPIVLPSDLAIKPFDYVALGHLHRYQNLNPSGYPAVVYSGSIDRIDFGERKETKGFCHVRIPEKDKAEHTFVPLKTRPFIQIDVSIVPEQNQTKQVIDAIKKHTIQDAVVKIVCSIPDNLPNKIDKRAIQNACSQAWYIAGIAIRQNLQIRHSRSGAQTTMPLEQLLDIYFSAKPELRARKKELIAMTLALREEQESNEVPELFP